MILCILLVLSLGCPSSRAVGDFNANNEINTRDLLNSSEEMGDVSIEDSQEGSLGSASLLLPSWLEVNKSSTNVNLGPIEAFLEALSNSDILTDATLMANLNTAAIQIAAENNETWSNSTETFDSTILESLASTIGLNETDEETLSFDDQLTDVGIEEETPNVEDVGIIIEVSQRVVDDNISVASIVDVEIGNIGTEDIGSGDVEPKNFGAEYIGSENIRTENMGTDDIETEDTERENIVIGNIGIENIGTEDIGSENVGSENIGTEAIETEDIGSENVGTEAIETENVGTETTETEENSFKEYPLEDIPSPDITEAGEKEEKELTRSRRTAGRPSYYGAPSINYYHGYQSSPIRNQVYANPAGGTYYFRPVSTIPIPPMPIPPIPMRTQKTTTQTYAHVIHPTTAPVFSTTTTESYSSTTSPPSSKTTSRIPNKVVTKPTKRPSRFWFL